MPLIRQVQKAKSLSTYDETAKVVKSGLYTAAVASAASLVLGNVTGSSTIGTFQIPTALILGGAIGIGTSVGVLGTDLVVDKFVDASARPMERTIIRGALASFGGAAAAYLLKDETISVSSLRISLLSYAGGNMVYESFDANLLGMLW